MNELIYAEVKGNGKNIVLIHGWGMHGGIWGGFNDLLSQSFQTHCLDLPGFGFSRKMNCPFTLTGYTKVVEEYINTVKQPVILLGWSLGGLVVQNILKRNKVALEKIVLIATTPSFTKKKDWLSAMEQSVFNAFAKELELDYKKTLKRFLSLQTRGSDLSRDELRQLNKEILARGEPNINALQQGLDILSSTDLRCSSELMIPAMIVLGEKDTLVPISVKDEFKKTFSTVDVLTIEKTGHVPFISKPKYCAEKIKSFING